MSSIYRLDSSIDSLLNIVNPSCIMNSYDLQSE